MPVTEEWLNQQAQILLGKAEELYLPRKAFRFDGVKAGDAGPFVRFHLDGIGVGFELDRKALDTEARRIPRQRKQKSRMESLSERLEASEKSRLRKATQNFL